MKQKKKVSTPKTLNEGDFVVAKVGKKNLCLKVLSLNGTSFLAKPQKGLPYEDTENVELSRDSIIANLGPKPVVGNAYGAQVEPFLKTFEHTYWGALHYFTRLGMEERKLLNKALDKAVVTLGKKFKFNFLPIDIEICVVKGKYAGSWHWSQKGDETTNKLKLRPDSGWGLSHYSYVLAHEFAHGIWYNMVTNKWKAKWVKAYSNTVKLSNTTDKQIAILLKNLTKSGLTPAEFYRDIDEDKQPLLDACIEYMSQYWLLDGKALTTLVTAGESLEQYWPKSALELFDQEVPISEYANKNVEEFWAEAFAFIQTGKKVPKSITHLMEQTLQHLNRKPT